jgi:hypothetical protein
VGARFSAHVQTGLGAHPTSFTMGTRSFPGLKRPGRGVDHLPPSSAMSKKEWSYTYTHKMSNEIQHWYLEFIAISLHMFRVISVPIIRSTITAVDSQWYNICYGR